MSSGEGSFGLAAESSAAASPAGVVPPPANRPGSSGGGMLKAEEFGLSADATRAGVSSSPQNGATTVHKHHSTTTVTAGQQQQQQGSTAKGVSFGAGGSSAGGGAGGSGGMSSPLGVAARASAMLGTGTSSPTRDTFASLGRLPINSPRKDERPDETLHIDYSGPASPGGHAATFLGGEPGTSKPQYLVGGGTGTGTGTMGRTLAGVAPGGTMLSVAEATSMVTGFKSGIRQAGWLYKLCGKSPLDISWKKYWFFIAGDRLYYTADPEQRATAKTRYIALDRIPVRPLLHRRQRVDVTKMSTPDIGVSLIDTRVMANMGVKLTPNTCFGLVSGAHTYFLAADTPEEARRWVKALRATWEHCYTHTLRGTDVVEPSLQDTSRLMAANLALTSTVRDLEGKAAGADSEYWKNWLEEKSYNRELEGKLKDLALYEIEVKTGSMKGANSDARIFVEMFGPYDKVSTGEVRLVNADSHQPTFGRGARDLFFVTAKNVGLPKHIKVWHDNTGRHPEWFLDEIRIRKRGAIDKTADLMGTSTMRKSMSAASSGARGPGASFMSPQAPHKGSRVTSTGMTKAAGGPWAVFPCGRWFSTRLDDSRIMRQLFAGHATPLIQYTVEVVTSDLRGAGTDANVHLVMQGTLGTGKRHMLSSGYDDFDRHTSNVFTIDDEELGELLTITIGHDGTGHGASWHCDHVAITNEKTGGRFLFQCRDWFDARLGDGRTERTLTASNDLGRMAYYTFSVSTSDIRGAGTDADVYVALHGDMGDSLTVMLPSQPEHFERGQTDEFRLQLPWVGRLRTLTIGHNNKGPGPAWHLHMVEVKDEEEDNKVYFFSCGKWFGLGLGDNLLERTLVAVEGNPRDNWTDYRLDFYTSTLRGAGTDANVYFQLIGEKGDSEVTKVAAPREAFERGSKDTFTYKMPFLGKLTKLLIQTDNSGDNAAWHLFKVDVTCAKDKKCTVFVCNDWLRSDQPEVYPSIELLPGLPVPLAMTYRVEVTTAEMKGTGTTSSVFLELHGATGRLGPIQLDAPNAFDRGNTDSFDLDGYDLGQLSKAVISIDGQGLRPLWNLEHLLVYRDGSSDGEGATYFPCRQWFDKDRGMSKVLFPMDAPNLNKINYTIRVFTSDLKGAGTDANIEINLLGEGGDTGYQPLLSNHDAFERGMEDVFPLSMRDPGRPTHLLIKSDGLSKKPTWHVDHIVVESQKWPTAYFLANCWLGPSTLLEARLPVMWSNPKGGIGTYLVHVYTSDEKNSGTDAGITIEILGDRDTSGRQPLLDMAKDTFERGQMDEFRVTCHNLGGLRAIRIESDGKSQKPIWHMDRICIQDPTGQWYFFSYRDWIAAPKLCVEIPASLLDPAMGRRTYKVVTHTSQVPGAGTDANVYIDLAGQLGTTGRVFLKNASVNPFERGMSDEFNVPTNNLGALIQLKVGHDNSGQGPAWHLEQVDVTDPTTGQTWYFDCNAWLGNSSEGNGQLERVLVAQAHNPRASRNGYIVTVKTSNIKGSGTDSQVYVDIQGSASTTGRVMLRNADSKNFEEGQTDEFTLQCKDLGQISQMWVGHDNSGNRPGWHPEMITVTDMATRSCYWFDANKWFSTRHDDGVVERVLPALTSQPYLRRTVPYQVVVITSDIAGAGTDSRVHMVMVCEDGTESGRLALDKAGQGRGQTVNLFERGNRDTFELQCLEMDPIAKLRIGHDNSGQGGSWHLSHVEVTNRESGVRTIFPCNNWLSKTDGDGQIERVLVPGVAPVAVPKSGAGQIEYLFEVSTSDISGAGTDANVFVTLSGDGGDTGALKLDNPGNDFESGKTDVFIVRAKDVGEPQTLKVSQDGKGFGAAWHLDTVVVHDKANPSKKFYFYAGRWLDKEHGMECLLEVSHTDPRLNMPEYKIIVHTSAIPGAGTDANVSLDITGTVRASGPRALKGKGNLFEGGAADEFRFKMPDLGELRQLEVWHDNGGLGAAWHLDYIEVQNSASRQVVYFPCSMWFDKKQGDGLIRRTLLATMKDPRTFKAEYRVSVWTSDVSGAGTDANVFIQIFGEEGETERIALDNPGNDFETGQLDVFEVSGRNVGPMTKIRIGHDNAGFGAAWHLDRVTVENKATGQSVTFNCGRWFSKKEDDGQVERDLLPSFIGGVNWRLVIVTGSDTGAGTDADVLVELFGASGMFGPQQLAAQKGAFETGCRDVFSLSTPELGQISGMALSHNNKGIGAAWQVASAELENMTTGEKWSFDFGNTWLDAKRGLRVMRPPSGYKQGAPVVCDYRVEITTGPNSDSVLSVGRLSLNIIGSKGATERQMLDLPQGGFQPNRIESYGLSALKDSGTIAQLEMLHEGTDPWYIQSVLVINTSTGAQGLFPCARLIQGGVPTVLDSVELPPCDYKVEVQTSDKYKAGTNARVFLNLFGVQGSTGRTFLEHADQATRKGSLPKLAGCAPGGEFARGACDAFVLRGVTDVGRMQQVEIGQDGSGMCAGWHLAWVRVTNMTTGAAAMFPCDQWLAKGEADKKTSRLLDASESTPPAGAPMPMATATAVVSIGPSVPFTTTLLRKMGGTVGAPGYRVTFCTSNAVMAGTSAPVFFELVGDNGSSGTVLTRPVSGQFSRGSEDTFVYPRLPFLGELHQVRVGTTGEGMFATWHLRAIDVVHVASGERWSFQCHNWIDKKTGWVRVLRGQRA
ncbi:hypothetical protein FOA52_009500 [Chlamydomonas sp. UWO 241]|nr:hypothetical protein FOA52_009500 [Chlamydomonas sp. UWO 241]